MWVLKGEQWAPVAGVEARETVTSERFYFLFQQADRVNTKAVQKFISF